MIWIWFRSLTPQFMDFFFFFLFIQCTGLQVKIVSTAVRYTHLDGVVMKICHHNFILVVDSNKVWTCMCGNREKWGRRKIQT